MSGPIRTVPVMVIKGPMAQMVAEYPPWHVLIYLVMYSHANKSNDIGNNFVLGSFSHAIGSLPIAGRTPIVVQVPVKDG
jgi:hypothetical protein